MAAASGAPLAASADSVLAWRSAGAFPWSGYSRAGVDQASQNGAFTQWPDKHLGLPWWLTMARFGPGLVFLLLLLADLITCRNSRAHGNYVRGESRAWMSEHVQLTDNSKQNLWQSGELRSPHYPRCCNAFTYLIEYGGAHGPGYIRMVFDDLDLPPRSILQFHNGKNDTFPLLGALPQYTRGGWTRPVIATLGNHVYVKFLPGPNESYRYAGFKISYYAIICTPRYIPQAGKTICVYSPAKTWVLDKPFTECPPLPTSVMDGGIIQLNTLRVPFDRTHFHYDCVWQLKVPEGISGLRVFLRITSMDLTEGVSEVNQDIYSESPSLKTYHKIEASNEQELTRIGQPPGGFTSNTGLYVRVKKPLEKGHFHFMYGVYKQMRNAGDDCSFTRFGQRYPGFVCRSSANTPSWCIPLEHVCNTMPNCPDASDEDIEFCRTFTTPAPITTTPGPCEKKCLDGTCVTSTQSCTFYLYYQADKEALPKPCSPMEKRCPGATCVHKYSTCPGECSPNEKKCSDGICVNRLYGQCPGECLTIQKECADGTCMESYERCPEEPCPWYSPLECPNGLCYDFKELCNGFSFCHDGTDEKSCDKKPTIQTTYNSTFNWKPLLSLICIPLLAICAIGRGRTVAKRQRWARHESICIEHDTQQTEFNGSRMFPMPAATAGVPAPMRPDRPNDNLYSTDPAGQPDNIRMIDPLGIHETMTLHQASREQLVAPHSPGDMSRAIPTAPPESGPPSYHGSSGAPSGLPGSEPPSYPPSSGPSSSHLELPGTSQKRLSVPTLASTLGSRSDVRGPPTYDEAMKDPCEEETEVHSPNEMEMQEMQDMDMFGMGGRPGGSKGQSKMMRHLLGFDYTYEDTTTEEDSSDESDDY